MSLDFFESIQQVLGAPSPTVRLIVGMGGGLVACTGALLYKRAVFVLGFGLGAVCGAGVGGLICALLAVSSPRLVTVVAALGGGVLLSILVRQLHRLALVLAGSMGGLILGVVGAKWAGVAPYEVLAGAVSALVGAIALPFVFDMGLLLFMPLVGSAMVAWSIQLSDNVLVLSVLWLTGLGVHLSLRTRARES